MSPSSGVLAQTRDASLLAYPRHDGVGGHRPGAWSPKYHVVDGNHPVRGESWSACGTVFLIAGGFPAETISEIQRCRRRGCRERWPEEE
jgi:hypothetical protein